MPRIKNSNDLGAAIRAERKRQGYTQQTLADYSGTSIMFISALERGKPTARLDKVLTVLSTLGLNLFIERR